MNFKPHFVYRLVFSEILIFPLNYENKKYRPKSNLFTVFSEMFQNVVKTFFSRNLLGIQF